MTLSISMFYLYSCNVVAKLCLKMAVLLHPCVCIIIYPLNMCCNCPYLLYKQA